MLRYAVFLIFIFIGFLLSRTKTYPIVAAIYGVALFYYTFLSRMELATSTEAVVSTAPVIQQHWWVNAAYEIFRMKTSSYHEAFILNIMLFVPMGYLLMGSRCAGKNKRCVVKNNRWWKTILICSAVSMCIEVLQEVTGFGMFDINDWVANTIGAAIGVAMMQIRASRHWRIAWK